MSDSEDFSIGTVSRLTGISQHTLRVWERRHEAVKSRRSAGGQRLYSSDDVERLTVLKALVDRGDRIGKIAAETTDALRARVTTHMDHSQTREQLVSGTLKVAAYGETLPDRLREAPMPGSRVLLADSDLQRFISDLALNPVDALVLEIDMVQPDTPEKVAALRKTANTERVLVVYGFGRAADVARLSAAGVSLLRAPVELHAVAQLLGLKTPASAPAPAPKGDAVVPPTTDQLEIPPRLLSREELQRLARVSTSVDCECPHHLVDLVRSLTAFEVYSEQCRSRDETDAALHAYLHATTARARALIEEALIKTAKIEGIEY
ncbi:MAG: MerR family transcriptional regulator [Pseudomonadota bacterium]